MCRIYQNWISNQVCIMIKLVMFFILIQRTFQLVQENNSYCNGRLGGCCAGFRFDSRRQICVECPTGYVGDNCEKQCPYPLFGSNCRHRCNCTKDECNSANGCVQWESTVNNFFSVEVHTARVTALMAAGNVGYDTLQKLNTSFLQHNTENNHDKKLSIDSTTENSAAPIKLSIMVLVCLGTIILGLYVASYKIHYFTVFKN